MALVQPPTWRGAGSSTLQLNALAQFDPSLGIVRTSFSPSRTSTATAPGGWHRSPGGLGPQTPTEGVVAPVPPSPPLPASGQVRYYVGFPTEAPLSDRVVCESSEEGDEAPECFFLDVYMQPPGSEAPWDPQLDDPVNHTLWLSSKIYVEELSEHCQARVDLVNAALYLLSAFSVPGEVLDWVMYHVEQSECDTPWSAWPDCVGFTVDGGGSGASGATGLVPGVVFQLLCPDLWGTARPGWPPLTVYITSNPTVMGVSAEKTSTFLALYDPDVHPPPAGEVVDFHEEFSPNHEPPLPEDYTEPNVFINLLYATVEDKLGQWLWGSYDERVCAALRLSAVILHEVLHLAGLDGGLLKHPGSGVTAMDPIPDVGVRLENQCNPWHVIVNTYLYAAAQRLGWRDGSGPQCCPFGADWYFFNDCHNYHLSPYSYGVAYQGPAHCVERPPDEWTPPSEWAWGASGPWDAIGDSDLTACAPASSPEVALPLP